MGVPERMNRRSEENKHIKEIMQEDFPEQKGVYFQNKSVHQVPSTVDKKSHTKAHRHEISDQW